MARFDSPLVGNVAEAGDIVLYAIALAVTLVVGLALFGMDVVIGRLRRRRARRRHRVVVDFRDRDC